MGTLPGVGLKGKNSLFFSESGHAAYRIKGNDACNNMQAKYLHLYTHSTPGIGSKGENIFLLQNMVMLHIKLKGMKHVTKCKQIFCPYTISRSKGQNIFFSESGHVTYKIKGKVGHAPCSSIP